jgi:pilus assembly protein Flp/PilA
MWTDFLTWLTARVVREEEGQGLVEYALILFLVSIAAIIMLGLIGTNVTSVFDQIQQALL